MKKWLVIFFLLHRSASCFSQQNTLDYFISQAIVNSPLLKDYEGQIQSLSIDSQLIYAALRPQLSGISNGLLAPVVGGWGYDEAITNKQELSALAQVTKSFLSSKTIATRVESLQIQRRQASNKGRITQQDLKKTIIEQYITVYGGQLELDFTRHINGILQREEALLKKLTRDNVYKQADYLGFVVTLQQQELNASQLEIQYAFDYSTLYWLAGIIDTTLRPLEDPILNLDILPDLSHSVFYEQFILDSLKLINDKALIGHSYRPTINVFADAGFNSTFSIKPYKNFGFSAGFNISIPIYDGHQKKLQYAKIDIQERTRLSRREFFVSQHDQQLWQLRKQLRDTEKLIGQINQQIRYTETLISVNEKLLASGDIRLADFILTLNNYLNAKHLVTLNYVSRLKIVNQLNYWAE